MLNAGSRYRQRVSGPSRQVKPRPVLVSGLIDGACKGWLSRWQLRSDGWWGWVQYAVPGASAPSSGWFPAARLTPDYRRLSDPPVASVPVRRRA